MELQLATHLQHHIANLLWNAEDMQAVKEIRAKYGKEADVVFHMMMAAHFDNHMDTDIARAIIEEIK